MAVTARIAATKAAGNYEFTLADNAKANFFATNLSKDPLEEIIIEFKDSSGAYHQLYYEDKMANFVPAVLQWERNSITIVGPIEARISKPLTIEDVEVSQHS